MKRRHWMMLLVSPAVGSDGWLPTNGKSNNAMVNVLVACGVSLNFVVPLSCLAAGITYDNPYEYPCPQSFALSPPLGIQNVVSVPVLSLPPGRSSALPTRSLCRESMGGDAHENALEYSIQGIIYMPSSTITNQQVLQSINQDSKLVITVHSVQKPSIVLAGAQIPLSQIRSFPMSFSLSKANLLVDPPIADDLIEQQWDKKVLYGPYDLVVSARILQGEHSSNGESVLLQGQGYSKLLALPYGDDDMRVVRAAASIRLMQSSSPDSLVTW